MSSLYLLIDMVVNLGSILNMCPIFWIGKYVCSVASTNTPLPNHSGQHTWEISNELLLSFSCTFWIQETSLTVTLQHISQQHCWLWWCLQTCDIWVTVSGVLRIALQSSSCQREPREDHLLFWTGGWAELSIVFLSAFQSLREGIDCI